MNQMFIEIQLQAAYADGSLHASESDLLRHMCRVLGVSELVFRQIEQRIRAERHHAGGTTGGTSTQMSLSDAYAILNVDKNSDDRAVKNAYRRLISQHHPDKLVAKGLPEEMMKLASQKTHEIKQAYDKIKQQRGMK